MEKLRKDDERIEGKYAAYVIAGILLAATFWASPSMGMLFLFALVICAAVCGGILALAGAITAVDSAATRLAEKPRPQYRQPRPAQVSRTASA
jgi:hypothetical protein